MNYFSFQYWLPNILDRLAFVLLLYMYNNVKFMHPGNSIFISRPCKLSICWCTVQCKWINTKRAFICLPVGHKIGWDWATYDLQLYLSCIVCPVTAWTFLRPLLYLTTLYPQNIARLSLHFIFSLFTRIRLVIINVRVANYLCSDIPQ